MEQSKKAVEKARPIKTVSLEEYQEGSVASRTLIDKKTGSCNLLCF